MWCKMQRGLWTALIDAKIVAKKGLGWYRVCTKVNWRQGTGQKLIEWVDL